MATLFDMILGACDKMGVSRHSVSTAGSSITLIDGSLTQGTADGDFTNGTIFFIASSAATTVEGSFRKITDYTAAAGTFTFSTVASTMSAVNYAYVTPEFSHELLIQKANEALVALGPLVFVAKDTITSSAGQDEYNASSTWKYTSPLRIDLQTSIASTSDKNAWQTLYDWEYEPSTAGGTGKIIFPDLPAVGRKFRVWYQAFHHRVTVSTAVIDERISPEVAKLALVEKLYEYRNSLNRGSIEFDKQRWTDAKMQLEAAKAKMPIWAPKRRRKLLIVGSGEGDHLPYPPPYGPS